MSDQNELRVEPRKIMRYAARISTNNGVSIKGRTIDISMSGISLMLEEPIVASQRCTIGFEALVSGKMVKIIVGAKVAYCTCVGTSGFRVGLQFDQHNEADAKTIRQLLQ